MWTTRHLLIRRCETTVLPVLDLVHIASRLTVHAAKLRNVSRPPLNFAVEPSSGGSTPDAIGLDDVESRLLRLFGFEGGLVTQPQKMAVVSSSIAAST